MVTSEQIFERKIKQPFKPFRIVTENGNYHEVSHSELIMVGQRECMIGTPSRKDPTCYEDLTRVAILNIKAIEDLPASKPASDGNGQD